MMSRQGNIPGEEDNSPRGRQRIESIKQFLSENLSADLHAGIVAGKFKLSLSAFHHLFKKYHHQSYRRYLEELRINTAFELLQKEGMRIKEVIYATGYKNRSTFSKAFKNRFKHSPGHFKK
jgi:AraC-like DNA-binding protein